jgi:hypothetical protein
VPNEGEVLARIREICLALPETSERLSHGAPTFFVREKRAFVMVMTDHTSPRLFSWGNLPVPPDPLHWSAGADRPLRGRDELAGIVEDAYAEVAPPKLVEAAQLDHE